MLYLFDKNENLIHELASDEMESLIQHEELNKLMTLEFAVFIDSNDKMKDIEYIAHKDMEDYQKIQMYRIIGSESDDNTVNYQAVHIIYDELKAYGYIRDKRPEMVKASAALDIALAGSRWKVRKVDDSQLLSTNFYDSTRLDALSKIIKTWNLDLHFYLTFDGNKITGRYVDLLEFRGEDTGERFVYGTNALEVIKEVDVSEVYTRVIPRGKGEEKVDEEGKPTDGYGRRIKIDDVVWEKSKGDPIDKPKGQESLELKEMTNKFGFSDGEARTRVQIFEDIEDPKELIKAGYDFLVKVSRPLVQFKTKISKRSRTNVGDIVRIIRKDLDFYYRTRIYKAHRNLLNETLEVEFGDKLVQSPADREKIVSDSLSSLEERIKETETDLKSSFVDKINESITHATFNRDGYNYELKKGNKYGLPAGYYSFDREIDDNPQRVIYVGAGTLAIADSKKSNGDWNFRTFGTGKGFVADLLVAGTILGGNVRWNLEDGTFLIGKNADNYSMYWDGGTLHFRNVDIDLKNSKDFSEIKDDLDKKISKDDILEDKEIQEALKGKDGANGVPGKDGKDGMPGKPGADGKTSYMHFAYADSKDGVVGFTQTATSGKKYIGFYTDFSKADSTNYKDYNWSRYVGEDGEQGIPGKPGKDGKTPYFHTAWSDSSDGKINFSIVSAEEKKYIGTYTDYNKNDSVNPSSYTWQLVKGKDGKDGVNGIPGKAGADGKTPYFHTAWANSTDGSKDFSTSQAGEKLYIGTYTDFTKEDSNDPKKYTWQLVKGNTGPKGDKGDRGPTGAKGVDGKDGHTLTAEVWMEGEFRNHLTKDVNVYRKATYDGVEIEITDSNSEIFRDAGDGVWVRDGIAHTAWGNWNNKNNYLAEKFTIMYKGLKASSFARLDNVNDGEKGSPGKDGKNGIDGKDGKTGKIGQNLLRNSNVPVSNKDYNTNEWTLCETPTTGETMTFTAKVKLEKDDKLMVYNSGGMIRLNWWTKVSKSKDYVIYSSTFNWKDTFEYNGKIYEQTNPPTLLFYTHSNGNGENLNNNTVSIKWATLTRGDIPAIEWSPCYADVDDAIKAGKEESEEISRKLIKVESDFKVDSNKIKASVSSLSETTERSFVNLKKDMADADVKVETGIKNYVINNYSTKTQTDQKISNEVGSIKTSIGDIKQEITRTKTSIEQTDKKIETKVSKDGFASLVKQEFDSYKIQANKIDFNGSYVNVKGSFQTLNNNDDVGVKIDYNQVTFRDNRWEDKTFGGLRTTKILNKDKVIAINLFHYQTGYTGIMYWKNEDKLFHSYITCDKWNYTGNGGITPIIFHENVNCLRNSIRIGNWELVPDGDTLKIKPHDTKAGYIFQRGGLYRYYASGGKDVKTKID